MNIRLGRWTHFLFRNDPYCKKCETSFRFVHIHTLYYQFEWQYIGNESGLFPAKGCIVFCEKCWQEMDTDELIESHMEEAIKWNWDDLDEIIKQIRRENPPSNEISV